MEAVSADQYKINHLNKRIAATVVKYEGEIAEYAMATQVLLQERDEARGVAQALQQQVDELNARLREFDSEPDEGQSDEAVEGDSENSPVG